MREVRDRTGAAEQGLSNRRPTTQDLCDPGRASIGLSQDVMTTVFGQDVRALNRRSFLLDVMTAAFRPPE
ncbi:hypothetical protein VSK90_22485 [Bacillus swezeyi]